MATRFLHVLWRHDFADEPSLIICEVVDGEEVRKVEVFRDGRVQWAARDSHTGNAGLSHEAIPAAADLDGDEFVAREMGADEFAVWWAVAQRWAGPSLPGDGW